MVRRTASRVALIAMLWFSASPTLAQKSVSVLGLMSEDGDDELAAQLTDALRAEASHEESWRVAPSGASLSQLSMAFDCEVRTPRCLHDMTANLGMDLIVYGTLRREGTAVVAEVGLFDVYGSRIVATANVTVEAEAKSGELQQPAAVLVAGLFGREPPAAGAALAPAAQSAAEVEPEPKITAADAAATAEPEAAASANDSGSLRWLGWSLVGLSGAAAVMTVVSWAIVGSAAGDETFEQYRIAVGESGSTASDSCAEADAGRAYGLNADDFAAVKDVCAKGSTWQVLQYVFLGTALAAGAGGAIVLLTQGGDDEPSAKARPPRLALTPAFDRNGGSLTARLRF